MHAIIPCVKAMPITHLSISSSSFGDPFRLLDDDLAAMRERSAANACSCWGLKVQGSGLRPGATEWHIVEGDADDDTTGDRPIWQK